MKEKESKKTLKDKIAFISYKYIGHNFNPYIPGKCVDLFTTNYTRFNHQSNSKNDIDHCIRKNIFLKSEMFKLQWGKLQEHIEKYSKIYLYIGKAIEGKQSFPSRDNMGYFEIIGNILGAKKELYIISLGECDDYKMEISPRCPRNTRLNWIIIKDEKELESMVEKFQKEAV